MAKAIHIDQAEIERLVAKFREQLTKSRSIEGELSFKTEIENKPTEKAKIYISNEAYLKMLYLVDHFDGEVGWYGLTERESDYVFRLYDILVYPQTVTSATVETDELKLGAWDDKLTDEELMHRRFHGHSHVNFQPFPSGTDVEDRKQKVKMIQGDDYYIFLIINKKREYTVTIYDLRTNTQFETDDIELEIEEGTLDWFESLDNVEEHKYNYGGYGSWQNTKTQDTKTKTKKDEVSLKAKNAAYFSDDDDYYSNFYRHYGALLDD